MILVLAIWLCLIGIGLLVARVVLGDAPGSSTTGFDAPAWAKALVLASEAGKWAPNGSAVDPRLRPDGDCGCIQCTRVRQKLPKATIGYPGTANMGAGTRSLYPPDDPEGLFAQGRNALGWVAATTPTIAYEDSLGGPWLGTRPF